MRNWFWTQVPFLAFVMCCLAPTLVAISVLSVFDGDQQFLCDGDNCVEDPRSWVERNAVLFGLTAAAACSCVVLLVAYLGYRRKVRNEDPAVRWP